MKLVLYANGSSANHGCEAITRSTADILGGICKELVVTSPNANAERRYGVDRIAGIVECIYGGKNSIPARAVNKLARTLFGDRRPLIKAKYDLEAFSGALSGADIALSVGGDNYCYVNPYWIGEHTREARRRGVKTVLWGASVEPRLLSNRQILSDLSEFDLIIARESITHAAMRKAGLRAELYPDPAFALEPAKTEAPGPIAAGNCVGINLSPLVLAGQNGDTVMSAYRKMISYILEKCEFSVALIPHVVIDTNDDLLPLTALYREFKDSGRVCLVDEEKRLCAAELKDLISKCRLFVGARTHATVAAYSSCVPTLVLGYSVKSLGIAGDLFGSGDSYVLDTRSMSDDSELLDAFIRLMRNESEIRRHLEDTMPGYIRRAREAEGAVRSLAGGGR